MVVFGIDPGSRTTGFGVIDVEGNRLQCLDYGAARGGRRGGENDFPSRLRRIYRQLSLSLQKHRPEVVALEEVFHAVNARTALKLGQARGVALLAAAESGAAVFEYSPLEVKKAVVGYGRADKQQVQLMVSVLLHLGEKPEPHDAADALAVAICHALRCSKVGGGAGPRSGD